MTQRGHRSSKSAWTMPDIMELLEADIEAWRPETGDVVIGHIVMLKTAGEGTAFGSYPLITIQADNDGSLVNVHAFHTVLRNELMRAEIGVGDRIGIKYMGHSDGGDFNGFENYRVIADHQIMRPVPQSNPQPAQMDAAPDTQQE